MGNQGLKWYDKPLAGDGYEYDLMTRALKKVSCEGASLEIGQRRGGGTKIIMENLNTNNKIHIAVDPYGELPYENRDNEDAKRKDYSNKMRNESLALLYPLSEELGVNFLFFNMTDEEFFCRFSDGVPVYDYDVGMVTNYCFVHFDGPHTREIVEKEFLWVNARTRKGSVIVFDDIGHYDHDSVERIIFQHGWKLLEKAKAKASYKK